MHEVVEVWHWQIFPRYSVLVSIWGVFLQAAGCREALFSEGTIIALPAGKNVYEWVFLADKRVFSSEWH